MRYFIDLITESSSAINLPKLSFPKLWHVGDLKAESKRDGSYEGAGLSISKHPEIWRQIAHQVDGHTYLCQKNGNSFIDAYKLSPEQVAAVASWGEQNGLAEPGKVWTISAYDPHIGSWGRTRYGNKIDFERNWSFHQQPENAVNRAKYKEEIKGWASTPKLDSRVRCRSADSRHTIDMLLTVYAEDVLRIDGVWWQDRLSPDNLSAPRGVIVPSQVSSWSFKVVKTAEQAAKGL